MSGIRTGTRLEQLVALHRTTRVQHEYARRRGDLDNEFDLGRLLARLEQEIHQERRARPTVAAAVRIADSTQVERLDALGVTAHDVKAWAIQHGLLAPPIKRGRVANQLLDAYVTHHQQHQETP